MMFILKKKRINHMEGYNAVKFVKTMEELARNIGSVSEAITPYGVGVGEDATGGCVHSLTEAVMGITAGLVRIAEAIDGLSNSISEKCEE